MNKTAATTPPTPDPPRHLILEHSCGIFTALLSHVNTTSERDFVGIRHLLPSNVVDMASPSLTASKATRPEEVSKLFATKVLKWCVLKRGERTHLLQWLFFFSIQSQCVFIPRCELRMGFKRSLERVFTDKTAFLLGSNSWK